MKKHESIFFTLFLGALSAIAPLSIDMGLPGIPAIEATFSDAGSRGSMTLSLFLVGFSAAPLFIGPLSDRFGRRIALIAGLSFFSAAAICSAFAPSFTTLLLARFVQGAAGGAIATLPVVMVRDVLEGPSARAKLSQIVAILGIAPIVAPLIGAAILAIGSWRSIYLAQALVGVVELFIAATWLEETHPHERRRSLGIRVLLDGYRTILSDGQLYPLRAGVHVQLHLHVQLYLDVACRVHVDVCVIGSLVFRALQHHVCRRDGGRIAQRAPVETLPQA